MQQTMTPSSSTSSEFEAYSPYARDAQERAILAAMLTRTTVYHACIVCGAPIEPSYGGTIRRFCERPGCRKRGNRCMHRFQRWVWEQKTSAKLRHYWQQLLPESQRELEALLDSKWILTDSKDGTYYHRRVDVADLVTRMIDAERRAAWRKMERWTVVLEQRAEKAEAHEAALQQELEALRQLLPTAMHADIEGQPRYPQIVEAQTTNPRAVTIGAPGGERDEDDARTYAILAQLGIKPTAQALAEAEQEGDDEDEEDA